jgi:hypothetical protein
MRNSLFEIGDNYSIMDNEKIEATRLENMREEKAAMNYEIQVAKKIELEKALRSLFKKFSDETGLQVDTVYIPVVEMFSESGKRSFVYEMPEVTAKL